MSLKSKISFEYLSGKGLELGPLNNPLPVDPDKATVQYADRLPKQEALSLFPELEDIRDSIIDADLLIDFDTDPLEVLKSGTFDFVIANHVIEHLVNPIQFLKNISDNLRVGGRVFLTVPDKDFTFDKRRKLTTNQHLWDEYESGETKLRDHHIKEFLQYKEPVDDIHPAIETYFVENGLPLSYYDGNKIPLNPFKRKRLYEFHRQRSIHVHVWNNQSFTTFFDEVNEKLNLGFTTVFKPSDTEAIGETILLLEKR